MWRVGGGKGAERDAEVGMDGEEKGGFIRGSSSWGKGQLSFLGGRPATRGGPQAGQTRWITSSFVSSL